MKRRENLAGGKTKIGETIIIKKCLSKYLLPL